MGTSAFRLGASQVDVTKLREDIQQDAHGFAAGDVLRAGETAGTFQLAQADSSENAEVVGIISTKTTNSFTIIYRGEVASTGLAGFTTGNVLFLSADEPGKLTLTPPTLPGQVIKSAVVMTDDSTSPRKGHFVNYIGSVIGGEASVEVSNLQPVGTIVPFAGTGGSDTGGPTGWLLCDGATYTSVAGTTYADLFSAIGTAFGGSGAQAANDFFAVPDLRGRHPIGAMGQGSGLTNRTLASTGGAESVGVTSANGGELDTNDAASLGTISVMNPFVTTNYIIRYEKNSRASISGLLSSDLADSTGKNSSVAGGLMYQLLDSGGVSGASAYSTDLVNYRWSGLRVEATGHDSTTDKIVLNSNIVVGLTSDAGAGTRVDIAVFKGGLSGLTIGGPMRGTKIHEVFGVGVPGTTAPATDGVSGVTLSIPINFIDTINESGLTFYDIGFRPNGTSAASIDSASSFYAMNSYS